MKRKRERKETQKYTTPYKKKKKTETSYTLEKSNKSAEDKTKLTLNAKSNMNKIIFPSSCECKVVLKNTLKEFKINNVNLKTIKEFHQMALSKFEEFKLKNKASYENLLNKVLTIYDIDETINEFFLKRLNDYYLEHKEEIDESVDGTSNDLANLFFKYIFTLPFFKRKEMYKMFDYFGDNELFYQNDKKYFYENPITEIFKNFIKDVMDISLTINSESKKSSSNEYLKKLKNIYESYTFPQSSYKIPVKFGNDELMYINLITKFQSFLCFEEGDNIFQKVFFKYDIKQRFLALNFFEDYLNLEKYTIKHLQYILFCLNCFFLYYDADLFIIEEYIKEAFYQCSRFLYQNFNEKKKKIKEIYKCINNKIDIDNLTEDYLEKNILLIKYNGKEITINANNCFFLGNKDIYLKDLVDGKSFNFEYLNKKNFPLFLDESLNDDFDYFVKNFLQSKITTEYVNGLKNYPGSESPIFNDAIIKEIKNNSLWVKFPLKKVHGISDRDTYTIFFNNSIDIDNMSQFSIILSSKIITCGHENINHILRLILFLNNFENSKITPRDTVLYKNESFNKAIGNLTDQGDMWESILFNDKITKIYIMGSLFILDTNNFDLKIEEFKKRFEKVNNADKIENINKALEKLKANKNNSLAKYIEKFNTNDNNNWIQYEQYLATRTSSNNNYFHPQSLPFGICGTHGFDIYVK